MHVSTAAQAVIVSSTHQGRLLPLALSEHFGELGNVKELTIDIAKKTDHFPMCNQPDEILLVIHAIHNDDSIDPHRWLINARHLSELHPKTQLPMFQAHVAAKELVRLYPHK